MVQNLLSMLSGISNEKEKAAKDVDKNTQNADNVDDKAKQTANETKTDIKEILNSISTNEATIQSALDDIKALSGDDGNGGELQAQKQKLEEIAKEIEEQKEIINSGVTNFDEKKAALLRIKELSGEITELVAQITEIEKSITSLNNVVEEGAENIETLTESAANVVEDGSQKLEGYMTEAGVQLGKNATDSTKGTVEEVAGAKLTATGGTTSFVPVIGQTVSAKAIQLGTDLIAAGGIRISGAASNIGKLTAALGKMGQEFTEFGGALNNVIGSATKATELIGQYGQILNPTITAIGSWAKVADGNDALTKEIANAETKLGDKTETKPQTNYWNNASTFDYRNQSQNQNTQAQNVVQEQIFNFDAIKQFGI